MWDCSFCVVIDVFFVVLIAVDVGAVVFVVIAAVGGAVVVVAIAVVVVDLQNKLSRHKKCIVTRQV